MFRACRDPGRTEWSVDLSLTRIRNGIHQHPTDILRAELAAYARLTQCTAERCDRGRFTPTRPGLLRRRAAARADCAGAQAALGAASPCVRVPSPSPRRAGSLGRNDINPFGRRRWTRSAHTHPREGGGADGDAGTRARPRWPVQPAHDACRHSWFQNRSRGPDAARAEGPKVRARTTFDGRLRILSSCDLWHW
jgi:hypothetical protein